MNHLDILFKYIENKHIKQINELQKERDNNIRIARQKVKDRVAISLYNVLPAKTKKDVKKDLKAVAAAATVAKTPVAKGAPKSAKSAKTPAVAKTTAAVAKTTPAAKATPVTPAVTPAVAASRTSGRVATPKRLFDL